jgi:hypothetical protein
MYKKIHSLIFIFTFALLFLITSKANAFQITDNQTVDANKTWTINFTGEVGFDDLTKKDITITDSKGAKVGVTVSAGTDNKSVIVSAPQGGYTPGESYTLTIGTNAHSKEGKSLKQQRTLHFNIKNSSTSNTYSFTSSEDLSEKEFVDLKGGEIKFDGSNVTARLNLRGIPATLKFNKSTTKDYYYEYNWVVYISDGTNEYELSTYHGKDPGSIETEMPIQEGVKSNISKVFEGSFKQGDWSSEPIGEATLTVDTQNNSLILTGQIPGLDASKVSYVEVQAVYDTEGDYSSDSVIVLDK